MKFLADTANLTEIEYCFSRGVNDGITTNPKIMELTGDLSLGFEAACKSLVQKYSSVPISLETDLRGMSVYDLPQRPEQARDILLEQAESLSKLGNNVVIKIPVSQGGLDVATILEGKGVKTNVTACMTPYQALEAARSGATYVSMFANRMLDAEILSLSGHSLDIILTGDWKKIVKGNKEAHFDKAWDIVTKKIAYVASELDKTKSNLIVGSIRSPEDIHRLSRAEPQIITIPTKIVEGLENIPSIKARKRDTFDYAGLDLGNSIVHPMTTYTLNEFEIAANTYRK